MAGPNFILMNDLIPVVIQDYKDNEVLMVGYMNQEAYRLTITTSKVHYYSRKKKRIWQKGEQSGHYQLVKQVFLNCDNTSLLIKVEQLGGACDQGYKSCFDKVLKGEDYETTGTLVFDPRQVYGKNFTERIILGIPSGSLEAMTFRLLEIAGYDIERPSNRSYHPKILNDINIELVMARAQELPILVGEGILDSALTGIDLVEDSEVSVRDVADLKYNKLGIGPVMLALAIPNDAKITSLSELKGKRIATMFPRLTQRFFESKGIVVKVVPSIGATEGKVPLVADAIVELVETGITLKENDLRPIIKLLDTSVHMIANNSTWGYTWKRKRLEEISTKLIAASNNLPKKEKANITIPESKLQI